MSRQITFTQIGNGKTLEERMELRYKYCMEAYARWKTTIGDEVELDQLKANLHNCISTYLKENSNPDFAPSAYIGRDIQMFVDRSENKGYTFEDINEAWLPLALTQIDLLDQMNGHLEEEWSKGNGVKNPKYDF